MGTTKQPSSGDLEQEEARRGLRRLLQELARWMLLDFGINTREGEDMLRSAFALAARTLVPNLPDGQANMSGIADFIGLRRQDIPALLGEAKKAEESKLGGWREYRLQIQAVMDAWPKDLNDKFQVLPVRGPIGSFEALVKRYLGVPRLEALLTLLFDSKAAKPVAMEDGQAGVQLLRRRFGTGRVDPSRVIAIADHIHAVCTGVQKARKRGKKVFFTTRIESQVLEDDSNLLPMLRDNIAEKGRALNTSIQYEWNDPMFRSKDRKKKGPRWVYVQVLAQIDDENAQYESPTYHASQQQARAARRNSTRVAKRGKQD